MKAKEKPQTLTSSKVQRSRLPPGRVPGVDGLRRDELLHLDQIARFACLEQIPQGIVGHGGRLQIHRKHRAIAAAVVVVATSTPTTTTTAG